MARIQEVRHPNEPWLMYWLGNLLSIDSDYVWSLGIAWLFKEEGRWVFVPRFTGDQSLFFNAVFFVRWTNTPFSLFVPILMCAFDSAWPGLLMLHGLFWSVRWSASTTAKAIWQAGLGFKLNGRFAILFRFQSDDSSAAGVTGQNFGQASGFEYGTH